MLKSTKRRVLAALCVVLGTQMLSACIVVPVPAHRARAVVIEPGYGYPAPREHRDPYWRR
jgi:hypothetical protein